MEQRFVRRRAFAVSSAILVWLAVLVATQECYAEPNPVEDNNGERIVGTGSSTDHENTCQLHGKGVWEGRILFRELSEAMPRYVGITSAGFHIAKAASVRNVAEPNCMNSSTDADCWLALERSTENLAWSLAVARDTSISYQGQSKCANGNLSGSGTTTWQWTTKSELRIAKGEGAWRNGKQQGPWKYELISVACIGLTHEGCRLSAEDSVSLDSFKNGAILSPKHVTTLEGHYEDGARSGNWEAKFNNGDAAKIPYSNDLKHGSQTYTKVTLLSSQSEQLTDHFEIPWVEGKKHGRQVRENTFGEHEEIPWFQGVVHGESAFTWATGENETITWTHGKQHETSTFTWPDGSRLTTLYDKGIKIGYEVLSLSPQSGEDTISSEKRYVPDKHYYLFDSRLNMLEVERTYTRRLNGKKHGVSVHLSPSYGRRVYLSYLDDKPHGAHFLALERLHGPHYFFFREESRSEGMNFRGRNYGVSVLIAADGYRQESPYTGGDRPAGSVIEASADGNYRSRLPSKSGLQIGTSIRCWYDNIPWSNQEMQGVDIYRWIDGRLGLYSWKYVSWHGPLSYTESNGLCLETPYDRGEKSGIEVQTQTNGYRAHIPMRGRHIAGPIIVFRPDGSRREIPYESGRKHGVVYDFSASGVKTRVEEYDQGSLVTP